jgi:hypothetical protein
VSVPPRQQVSTYTGSAIGLFARFTEGAATAGGAAPLDLRLTTAVDSLRVVAFGREMLVPGSELARVARVDVPAGTAPGLYDVVVTAQAGTRTRTVTVRLDVR